jgi:hypothetical protein
MFDENNRGSKISCNCTFKSGCIGANHFYVAPAPSKILKNAAKKLCGSIYLHTEQDLYFLWGFCGLVVSLLWFVRKKMEDCVDNGAHVWFWCVCVCFACAKICQIFATESRKKGGKGEWCVIFKDFPSFAEPPLCVFVAASSTIKNETQLYAS